MTARPAFHNAYTLAAFEHAEQALCSPGIALLDRLWTQAHQAREESTLDAGALTSLTPERRAAAVLYPHTAARWAWFTDAAVAHAWGRYRHRGQHSSDVVSGTGVLITRLNGAVQWQPLDAVGHAFLCLFADGGTFAQAAAAVRAADLTQDHPRGSPVSQVAATLLAAGAFNRISITRIHRQFFRRA